MTTTNAVSETSTEARRSLKPPNGAISDKQSKAVSESDLPPRTYFLSSSIHNVLIEDSVKSTPSYQAFQILRAGLVAAPILAGADKFFHLLTNWDMYLAPVIAKLSPVVEIGAGVLVALKPRIGAYVVAGWLVGSIINLLLIPGYFDVALRDFGLSLGALALARLSSDFDAWPQIRRFSHAK
jgi:hypothetical protein